jgi:hypothetical protein
MSGRRVGWIGSELDARRREASAELERAWTELGRSVEVVGQRARHLVSSPERAVRAHLGWCLLGAFAMGVGLARRRRE